MPEGSKRKPPARSSERDDILSSVLVPYNGSVRLNDSRETFATHCFASGFPPSCHFLTIGAMHSFVAWRVVKFTFSPRQTYWLLPF